MTERANEFYIVQDALNRLERACSTGTEDQVQEIRLEILRIIVALT
jgi:hypothetical protein